MSAEDSIRQILDSYTAKIAGKETPTPEELEQINRLADALHTLSQLGNDSPRVDGFRSKTDEPPTLHG